MIEQLNLTFTRPRSRRGDPPSSLRAEEEMRRSGAMKCQRAICLELVKQYPGRSSKELSKLGSLDRYQVARRCSDLRAMGLVIATQHGNEDQKWWVK